ncbi:MAG: hypothetical protein HYX57_06960 [Chloroflexi bacterium]|nr:hypothetical protein [Chloroflexota bacterium]
MPFRPAFDCLWCGEHHATRATDDLEGWAHLCPDCVGRAADNEFLRFRLRRALAERSTAAAASSATSATAPPAAGPPAGQE